MVVKSLGLTAVHVHKNTTCNPPRAGQCRRGTGPWLHPSHCKSVSPKVLGALRGVGGRRPLFSFHSSEEADRIWSWPLQTFADNAASCAKQGTLVVTNFRVLIDICACSFGPCVFLRQLFPNSSLWLTGGQQEVSGCPCRVGQAGHMVLTHFFASITKLY